MSDTTVEVSISLTEQQSKDLQRFYETTEDGQGYDVPADCMKSLARVGLVRSLGFSRFEFTDVGDSLVEQLRAGIGSSDTRPMRSLMNRPELDDLGVIRDRKIQELRKFIEHMKQSRDEVSIAYNEGLFEGRLSELKDLGVLSADDVLALETEAASES